MNPLSLVSLSACLFVFSVLPSATHAHRLGDSLNACQLLKHPVNFGTVQRNALKIVTKSDEDCVLKFIDLLADSSSGSNHHQYLACLDAICRVSDGDISEDLTSVCAKLFHKNFNHLFEHLYKSNVSFKTRFEQLLIEGVAADLKLSKDSDGERAKLVAFVQGKKQEMKMNGHQKVYAETLKNKILAYKVE